MVILSRKITVKTEQNGILKSTRRTVTYGITLLYQFDVKGERCRLNTVACLTGPVIVRTVEHGNYANAGAHLALIMYVDMLPARTDAPAALEIKILDGMMSDNPTSGLCGLS